MSNAELEKYIAGAKEKGVPGATIKTELIKYGWPEVDINEALNTKSESAKLQPPPPFPRFGMWVSFQYIILFICLYISATSLAGIMHWGVDNLIEDEIVNVRSGYLGLTSSDYLLKGYVAGIIVSFPIFAVLLIILKKQLVSKPGVKNLRARKILFYATLVGTFLIMVGHLISTIYGFLGGNTTMRLFAHLGVTFFVAGAIFTYLINEVKEDWKDQ